MRRFLLSVAAIGLALALTGTAEAGKPGGKSTGSRNSHVTRGTKFSGSRNSHVTRGTKFKGSHFKGGRFYRGREHPEWSHRYWWGKYGCYTYYCPSDSCWYYWYQPGYCYYPCSYIGSATPVAEPAPVGVPSGVTQIVNVTNNSPGSVPAGPVPPGPVPPGPPGQ